MKLGVFSLSLNIKDISKSKEFYEKLGFHVFGGNLEKKWLIMKNDKAIIGLFQEMLEKNTLTFNPGWDENAKEVDSYMDIREIQQKIKEQGLSFNTEVDESSTGPGYFILEDPDGNPILFDQHL